VSQNDIPDEAYQMWFDANFSTLEYWQFPFDWGYVCGLCAVSKAIFCLPPSREEEWQRGYEVGYADWIGDQSNG
jgi:hypothetical protein